MSISTALVVAGVAFAVLALLIVPFVKKPGGERSSLRDLGSLEKVVFLLSGAAGIALGLGLTGWGIAGVWRGLTALITVVTPAELAVLCLLFGLFPLLFTVVGLTLARLLGGSVNAAGATDCNMLGLNLNYIVHSLFMSYWLVLITGGAAVFGLIGCGIWALFYY